MSVRLGEVEDVSAAVSLAGNRPAGVNDRGGTELFSECLCERNHMTCCVGVNFHTRDSSSHPGLGGERRAAPTPVS